MTIDRTRLKEVEIARDIVTVVVSGHEFSFVTFQQWLLVKRCYGTALVAVVDETAVSNVLIEFESPIGITKNQMCQTLKDHEFKHDIPSKFVYRQKLRCHHEDSLVK
jgi:hypothetical protein